ncbi:Secreted RxLR effector peptide protein [Phytophthora palmivora]|uniref:Secreted RxLR effector peptide protein n=1 Tax=Phytophthora palmivora TaxID=4796 RepID=A0A2P4YKF9_9STRA|nr:Secreted RxLR effector peptide protein [Phytophthora palmivora]
MRFFVFLALLVVILVSCYTSFAGAEITTNDVVFRHLRAAPVGNSANIAGRFASHVKEFTLFERAVKKAMIANGNEKAIRAAIKLAANIKDLSRTSDEQIAKISQMIAEGAKKSPKSWPRLMKFTKVTLGAAVGGLAIYGAYKLLVKDNAVAVAATTNVSA